MLYSPQTIEKLANGEMLIASQNKDFTANGKGNPRAVMPKKVRSIVSQEQFIRVFLNTLLQTGPISPLKPFIQQVREGINPKLKEQIFTQTGRSFVSPTQWRSLLREVLSMMSAMGQARLGQQRSATLPITRGTVQRQQQSRQSGRAGNRDRSRSRGRSRDRSRSRQKKEVSVTSAQQSQPQQQFFQQAQRRNTRLSTGAIVAPNMNLQRLLPPAQQISQQSMQQPQSSLFNPASVMASQPQSSNMSVNVPVQARGLKTLYQTIAQYANRRPSVDNLNTMAVDYKPSATAPRHMLDIYKNASENVPVGKLQLLIQAKRDATNAGWRSIPNAVFEGGVWSAKGIPNSIKPVNMMKRQDILGKVINPNTISPFITPLVAFIDQRLKNSGFQGMGPISRGGLPLYLGRWIDQKTKKIRTLPKPNYQFNTKTWKGAYQKVLLTAAYKWNQYVRAQQNVDSIIRKFDSWGQLQKAKQEKNSVKQRRRKQMLDIINKISINDFKLSKFMSELQKAQIITRLREWNYQGVAAIIQGVAKAQLLKPANQLTSGQVMALKQYSQWRMAPINTVEKNNVQWGGGQITTGLPFPIAQLKRQNRSNQRLVDISKSDSIAAYYKPRIVDRGTKLTRQQFQDIKSKPSFEDAGFGLMDVGERGKKRVKLDDGQIIANLTTDANFYD